MSYLLTRCPLVGLVLKTIDKPENQNLQFCFFNFTKENRTETFRYNSLLSFIQVLLLRSPQAGELLGKATLLIGKCLVCHLDSCTFHFLSLVSAASSLTFFVTLNYLKVTLSVPLLKKHHDVILKQFNTTQKPFICT